MTEEEEREIRATAYLKERMCEPDAWRLVTLLSHIDAQAAEIERITALARQMAFALAEVVQTQAAVGLHGKAAYSESLLRRAVAAGLIGENDDD